MWRKALAALTGVVLGACAPGRDETFHTQRLFAMGTWVEIAVELPDAERRAELGAGIEALLRAFERDYYPWADGELARLNRALARGESVRVSAELADLLRASQRYSEESGGAFEPAVGALVELWGFHDATAATNTPPEKAAITAWLDRDVGIRNLTIAADGTVTQARGAPATLDLGGIAKGTAADRIIDLLESAHVANALVNAGGSVRVLGSHAGRPWRVGIQAPRSTGLLGVVALESGEAVDTSGDYERFYEHDGQRMHHILDPRTGYPVMHTQAVTVIAGDDTLADAASTALFVAGPSEWRAMAEALGVTLVLRVDASGAIEMTAPMRDRLQTEYESNSPIIAVVP
jgi:thiamine biosynthesis lipoprotein